MIKKMMFFTLILLLVIPLMSQQPPQKRVRFFSPGSFYVYAQGAWVSASPDGIYGDKENAFAPILGLGCRVINMRNSFFLNIEFDYSQAQFTSSYYADDGKVEFYNFKLGGELMIKPQKMSLFLNVGVTNMNFSDLIYYFDESELVMNLEFGLKAFITKHLAVRADARFFLEPEDSGYWFDDYYDYYYEDDSRLAAFALCVGLQYHF